MLSRLRSLDPWITFLTFGLCAFGLAVLLSASGPVAMQRTGNSLYYVRQQFLFGMLPGTILFFVCGLIDYRRWRAWALPAFIVSIVLLCMVYVPGLGVKYGGSRSWVRIGGFQFQPSELVKLTFLIYVSAWLAERKGKAAHDTRTGLIPFLAAVSAVMILLVFQPDTGSMVVIVGMALLLYFISGAPLMWFVGLCGAGFALIALLIKVSPYRAARFMTFLHPELDPQGIGYHINQALLAIGSGGLFGLGFGNSRQKFLYLPEVESDSITAVMGEELGFVVMAGVIIAFGLIIGRCLMIARDSRDRFGTYLASGVAAWIGLEVLLNIGSMTGLMPMTGVTLPFISHGGTAMAILLGALGMVAGIPRTNERYRG